MILKTVIGGIAIASVWFWLISLFKKDIDQSTFKDWIKIIVPQGIVIVYALILFGVI